jgi:hypothetical protein
MNKILKKVAGALVALVVLVLAKFKAAGIFAIKVLIVSLIHSAVGKDSTATVSRPQTSKPARQVAQAVPSKSNPADKLAGPMAPVTGQAAVTPSAPLGAGPIQAARNAAAAPVTGAIGPASLSAGFDLDGTACATCRAGLDVCGRLTVAVESLPMAE